MTINQIAPTEEEMMADGYSLEEARYIINQMLTEYWESKKFIK